MSLRAVLLCLALTVCGCSSSNAPTPPAVEPGANAVRSATLYKDPIRRRLAELSNEIEAERLDVPVERSSGYTISPPAAASSSSFGSGAPFFLLDITGRAAGLDVSSGTYKALNRAWVDAWFFDVDPVFTRRQLQKLIQRAVYQMAR